MFADVSAIALDPLIAGAKQHARRRRLLAMVVIAAVLAGVVVTFALRSTGGDTRIVRAAGISVHVPGRWFITRRPLNGITDPRQRLVISSFPIASSDFRRGNEQVFRPPATGVLVQVDEQLPAGGPGFPPRPAHLRLGQVAPLETFAGSRWAELTFKLTKRDFYAFVWIGRRAPALEKRQVLAVLDGMRVDSTQALP